MMMMVKPITCVSMVNRILVTKRVSVDTAMINESNEVQSRLRAQQLHDQLQGILENLPGVVFRCVLKADGSLHYPYISTGTHEVLGYKTEELQVDPSVLFRATHALDFERFYAEVQRSACMLAPMSIEYRIVGKSGQYKWVRDVAKPRRLDNGDVVWDGLLLDISDRKDVEEKLRLHSAALSSAANSIVIVDCQGSIVWVNPAFTRLTGYSFDEAIGQNPNILNSGKQDKAFFTQLWKTVLSGKVWAGELINRRKDSSLYSEEMTITPVFDEIDEISHFIAIKKDISGRKQLEAQLIQAQKLESIGQLAAGIAHEINTPIQYVGDNTHFLREAFEDLWKLVGSYERLLEAVRSETISPELLTELDTVIHDVDSEYLKEEIPIAIEQSLSGVKQISRIVGAMKEFSHPGSEDKELIDLNRMIENTVTVARNEWKYVAEMTTDLDSDLPPVPGIAQVLGQVVLNIVVNAAHAIADVVGDGSNGRGKIKISTRVLQNHSVEIRITDTGKGIPEAISNNIFDPFFTTKDVGKGTGQGLAIAYSAVVDRHDGRLSFESEVGKGTTFIIELPLEAAAEESKGVAA
jgi:PAS domain S-box-containing protein